ncbi:MAG: VPLPA-CTERM sorting domain-containing protein [Rhizobacter sp.]|nr:VPLPA-CTERM sorting domain-containing protein [Rhizobacter sp.]
MNSFLPSSVTTLSGDGAVTGDKTPEAGLLLNSTTNANFADSSFSAWMTGQNTADVRWMLSGADGNGTGTTTNVRRVITTSVIDQTATNGQVDGYIASGNAGNLAAFTGAFGLSVSGASGAPSPFGTNFGLGAAGLASLDQAAGLFYFARTTGTGSTTTQSNKTQFGNTTGYATVTLEADGDFVYSLAGAPVSAVPIPAAAWLLGSGLFGLVGMARRRKAAAQA